MSIFFFFSPANYAKSGALIALLSLRGDCVSIHQDTICRPCGETRRSEHLAQEFDQGEKAAESSQTLEDGLPAEPNGAQGHEPEAPVAQPSSQKSRGIDWLALGIIFLVAIIFSSAGRLYAQPTTSLVPAAVLSASGCGMLITALKKLRRGSGVGLAEAALAGFLVAFLQFLVALSYPDVVPSLGNEQLAGPGFFSTWGLIAFFSALFSIVGATLGHLAFAPLRPLPEGTGRTRPQKAAPAQRTATSYAISVLLLGFIPMLVGFVFSAAFDFALSHNGYAPGPFPTLRLLSALLPWQIPDPIGSQGANTVAFTLTLLWRIPLFFGNPTPFDAQALEPLIFNAAGLAFLLMASIKLERGHKAFSARQLRSRLLPLESLLGLALVLPADLWMMQGLQGVFQFHNTPIPLGILRLLDPLTFALNLVTGPLLCAAIGLLVISRMKST